MDLGIVKVTVGSQVWVEGWWGEVEGEGVEWGGKSGKGVREQASW